MTKAINHKCGFEFTSLILKAMHSVSVANETNEIFGAAQSVRVCYAFSSQTASGSYGGLESTVHTPLNDMTMKDERRTNNDWSVSDVVGSEARSVRRLYPVLLVRVRAFSWTSARSDAQWRR